MRWGRGLIAASAFVLAAASAHAATITFPLAHGTTPLSVTLTLKSPQQMQAILPRILIYPDCPFASVARPQASAQARDAALALARAALGKPAPAATAPQPDRYKYAVASGWAQRILGAYGTAKDVGLGAACIDAAIEARLGLLTHGQLKARVAAGGPRALDAAIQLHRMGLKGGDALLLAKAGTTDPYALRYLLDLPPAQTRAVMLAFAQRFAAQQKPGQANPLMNLRAPALIYLTAMGETKARDLLLAAPLAWEDAQMLAMLAADPAPLLDPFIRIAGVDSVTSSSGLTNAAVLELPNMMRDFCAVTDTLSPADAEKFWSGAGPLFFARIQAQHATYYGDTDLPGDMHFPTFATGTIMAQSGPCRPSSWMRDRYLTADGGNWTGFVPYTRWVFHYWKTDQFLQEALAFGDGSADELDYIPQAAFDAKLGNAPGSPQDILLAYRRTAMGAGLHPSTGLRYLSDTETRPYLLGQANQAPSSGCGYDTTIGGVLHLQPQLAGNTLKLAISLDQVASYAARNMYDDTNSCVNGDTPVKGGKQYAIDNGARLISSVKVWRNFAAVPVQKKPDAGGVFHFETPGVSTLDGIVVEVDLAVFEDRRQLFFPLYASDYAVHLRRGAHI